MGVLAGVGNTAGLIFISTTVFSSILSLMILIFSNLFIFSQSSALFLSSFCLSSCSFFHLLARVPRAVYAQPA